MTFPPGVVAAWPAIRFALAMIAAPIAGYGFAAVLHAARKRREGEGR